MPKRKNNKPRRDKKAENEWLKMMYEKTKREFTAADLQGYTEIEKGIPAEQLLAECEEIVRNTKRKRA